MSVIEVFGCVIALSFVCFLAFVRFLGFLEPQRSSPLLHMIVSIEKFHAIPLDRAPTLTPVWVIYAECDCFALDLSFDDRAFEKCCSAYVARDNVRSDS